ncbi:hypothetical protein [Desulfohalovibrio reitneri]|uniref:hypothetical protein n=1 Tax=Desulfohalovibrio reitneri TaxID=1307759 RepID=UPI0004A76FD2|nr:hypothetical protein [Desulfohalovibrio reitneri]
MSPWLAGLFWLRRLRKGGLRFQVPLDVSDALGELDEILDARMERAKLDALRQSILSALGVRT